MGVERLSVLIDYSFQNGIVALGRDRAPYRASIYDRTVESRRSIAVVSTCSPKLFSINLPGETRAR